MTNNSLLITLAQPNPDHLDTFGSYVGASTELALDVGGEVSSRFQIRQLVGDDAASVFGFATVINDMFRSPRYQVLVPDREKSIDQVNAYIVDDPAITALDDPADGGAYMIVVAAPNADAPDDLATYQQTAGPLFAKHGATPVTQLPIAGHPIGETPAGFVSILEFPSAESAEALFADPAYAAIVDVRDRALSSLNVYLTVH